MARWYTADDVEDGGGGIGIDIAGAGVGVGAGLLKVDELVLLLSFRPLPPLWPCPFEPTLEFESLAEGPFTLG